MSKHKQFLHASMVWRTHTIPHCAYCSMLMMPHVEAHKVKQRCNISARTVPLFAAFHFRENLIQWKQNGIVHTIKTISCRWKAIWRYRNIPTQKKEIIFGTVTEKIILTACENANKTVPDTRDTW